MHIIAKAAKTGLLINTPRGSMNVLQLWQMPLTGNNGFNLDVVSRDLLASVRQGAQESLVTTSKISSTDELRIEVLKFIIADKQADADARKQEVANIKRKQELQELIADKMRMKEQGRSLEDLEKELRSLS